MVQPASIVNTATQSTDTIYGADGTARVKMAIGDKAVGLTPHGAWQAVATHTEGDALTAADGVVVSAGVVPGTSVIVPLLVDVDGRVSVSLSPASGNTVDWGGVVAADAISQEVMGVNLTRKYLFIQNLDDAEDLWIDFTADAVIDSPSIRLLPNDTYVMEASYVTSEAVNVIAASNGHKFSAKEA